MGAAFSLNTNDIIQKETFELSQRAETECLAVSENIVSGSNFNVWGVVRGDVGINQTATGSAKCVIDTNLSAVAESVLESVTNNENTAPKWLTFGINVNKTTSQNELAFEIEQSIYNSCNTSSVNYAEDITFNIYASGRVGGNAVINQNATSSSGCVINNLASISAYSKNVNKVNNENGVRGVENIIIIIVAAVVIVALIGGLSAVLSGGKRNQECEKDPCSGLSGDRFDQCRIAYPDDKKNYCPLPYIESSSASSAAVKVPSSSTMTDFIASNPEITAQIIKSMA